METFHHPNKAGINRMNLSKFQEILEIIQNQRFQLLQEKFDSFVVLVFVVLLQCTALSHVKEGLGSRLHIINYFIDTKI